MLFVLKIISAALVLSSGQWQEIVNKTDRRLITDQCNSHAMRSGTANTWTYAASAARERGSWTDQFFVCGISGSSKKAYLPQSCLNSHDIGELGALMAILHDVDLNNCQNPSCDGCPAAASGSASCICDSQCQSSSNVEPICNVGCTGPAADQCIVEATSCTDMCSPGWVPKPASTVATGSPYARSTCCDECPHISDPLNSASWPCTQDAGRNVNLYTKTAAGCCQDILMGYKWTQKAADSNLKKSFSFQSGDHYTKHQSVIVWGINVALTPDLFVADGYLVVATTTTTIPTTATATPTPTTITTTTTGTPLMEMEGGALKLVPAALGFVVGILAM